MFKRKTVLYGDSMRPLIAANWKMHGTMDWVSKLDELEATLPAPVRASLDMLICPPFPFIAAMAEKAETVSVHIGAQTCHAAQSGAHTGDVSAEMLASIGASYIITGHSERRAGGETDADVKAKSEAALRAGCVPIICVGEPLDVREAGDAESHVEAQIKGSLPDDKDNIVIAYEPVWAIGTGRTASPEDIADMHAHIRGLVGSGVHILYGGSVKPANAEAILGTRNVNGALIGGAGLEMDSLAAIARAAL